MTVEPGPDESEMFHAIVDGSASNVERLLEGNPTLVNGRFLSNASFLHLAVNKGDVVIVHLLLSRGADVNKPSDPPLYCPPLCDAAEKGFFDIVEMLLRQGALVDGIDCTSVTPLMLAAREARLDVIEVLLDAGAEVNRLGYIQRFFPTDFAGWHGSEAAASTLRAKGGMSVSDDLDWESQRGFPIISHVSNDGGPVYPIAFTRSVNGEPFDFRLAAMRVKDKPLLLFSAGLYEYGGSVEVAFALPSRWPLKQTYLNPKSRCSFPIDVLELVAGQIAGGAAFGEGSVLSPNDAGFGPLEWPQEVRFLVAVNHSWRAAPLKGNEQRENDAAVASNGDDEPADESDPNDSVAILTLVPVTSSEKFDAGEASVQKWVGKKRRASWAKVVLPMPC